VKVDTHLLCGILALISDIDNLTVALENFIRPPSGIPSVAASAVPGVGLEVTKV
jgi:hypothetical protein